MNCLRKILENFCTVPYSGVDKIKVKVNVRRRLGEETPSKHLRGRASPKGSVAKVRRRLGEGIAKSRRRPARASPRPSVTEVRQSQCRSPIPMGRKDHGGSDAVGRPQIPIIRGSNEEKRKVASRP